MIFKLSRRALGLGAFGTGIAAAAMTTGAKARSIDDIVAGNTLRVGIHPNSPPFSSRNAAGEMEGFDVAIATMIAQEMAIPNVEWVLTETAQRIPFLVEGTIDIALGGLTRNAERMRQIKFTCPLHTEVMGVLTTQRSKAKRWQDLNDDKVTLADVNGAWTIGWARQNLPKAKLEVVASPADAVKAVAEGRATAIVEMLDFFVTFTKAHAGTKWRVLPEKIDIGWDAIGVSKDSHELRDVLNIILYKLHSSGFVDAQWQKAFGTAMLEKVPAQPYF